MRRRVRRRHPVLPHPTIVDVEPEDAPRIFEEGELETVEAKPTEPVEEAVSIEPDEPPPPRDVGLLYGVHVPPAMETELSAGEDHDSYRGADLGESFIEMLVEKSTELGPLPEHDVDVIDESDPEAPPPPTDHRDRPKADRGSGGVGGM
jgi:hypothetical protein